LESGEWIGPGKVKLLESIRDTGSISRKRTRQPRPESQAEGSHLVFVPPGYVELRALLRSIDLNRFRQRAYELRVRPRVQTAGGALIVMPWSIWADEDAWLNMSRTGELENYRLSDNLLSGDRDIRNLLPQRYWPTSGSEAIPITGIILVGENDRQHLLEEATAAVSPPLPSWRKRWNEIAELYDQRCASLTRRPPIENTNNEQGDREWGTDHGITRHQIDALRDARWGANRRSGPRKATP
jgi:hypothetical protein